MHIGFGEEEPAAKGPPPENKENTGSEARTVYKYPPDQNFFESLQFSHSFNKMHELLARHGIPGLGNDEDTARQPSSYCRQFNR